MMKNCENSQIWRYLLAQCNKMKMENILKKERFRKGKGRQWRAHYAKYYFYKLSRLEALNNAGNDESFVRTETENLTGEKGKSPWRKNERVHTRWTLLNLCLAHTHGTYLRKSLFFSIVWSKIYIRFEKIKRFWKFLLSNLKKGLIKKT